MKLLKSIALPFIWLFNVILELLIYVLYVMYRINLSLVPGVTLQRYRHFKGENGNVVTGIYFLVYWSIMTLLLVYTSLWWFVIVNLALFVAIAAVVITIWIKFSKIPDNEER